MRYTLRMMGVISLALLAAACVTKTQYNKAILKVESAWKEINDQTLASEGRRVFNATKQQGFMAAWSSDANQVTLAEHNCAVRAVAEQFPEICAAEAEFLKEVLQTDLQRDSYIPDGCNACLYSITPAKDADQSALSQEES